MKRFIQKMILLAVIIFVIDGIKHLVFAAASATLTYPAFTQAPSPADMVGQIYTYALSIAGALAIIRVVYGGIIYMISAGNTSKQSDARDIITSAIWGLVLLAGAYLLLNTINPEIVQLKNPSLPAPTPTSSINNNPVNPSFTSSCPANLDSNLCLQEVSMEKNLLSYGINLKSTGNCDNPNNKNCTSLYGFPQSGIDELITLKNKCDCAITITAGTETGHEEHGFGRAIVDMSFSPSLDSYIHSQISAGDSPSLNTDYKGADGNSYRYEDNHWHVRLGSSKGV
jgi:hypothetical protein